LIYRACRALPKWIYPAVEKDVIMHDVIIVIAGRIGFALGGLVSIRVATEVLTPGQMGVVAQVISMSTLFYSLCAVPVWHYMARGFLEWYDTGKLAEYIHRFLVFILVTGCLVVALIWLQQDWFHLVQGIEIHWVVALVGLYFVSMSMSAVGTNGFNILNKRIPFVIFSNIPIWVGLGLAVAMFQAMKTIPFWILGLFLGYTLACFSVLLLLREVRKKGDVSSGQSEPLPFNVQAVFRFAWPLILVAGLWWLQSQSYRFILGDTYGVQYVGLFAMGYSLAFAPIAMYESTFGQVYEPTFYQNLKFQDTEGQAKAWNHYAACYLPGLLVMGIFVASCGYLLAELLLGEQFREAAVQVVAWAAGIETMRAMGAMMYNIGIAKVDARVNLLPSAIGAVLSVGGVLVFTRIDPLAGTAAGMLLAGFAVLMIIMKTSKRKLPVVWPVKGMIKAVFLSLPLIIGYQLSRLYIDLHGVWLAVGGLTVGGVYVLALQWFLFHGEIRKTNNQNV